MEKLKSLLPDELKRMVWNSTVENLPAASSSLLEFLLNLPQFHQMVRDLAAPEDSLCAKNKAAAMELKKKGNQCYSNGDYAAALHCYSQALRVAPQEADDRDRSLVAALFLNRASVFHRQGLLKECLRDCNRALQISPSYSKAWYRRGKANAALGNRQEAILDLGVAKDMEISLAGKRQIECELDMIISQRQSASRIVDQCSQISTGGAGAGEPCQSSLSCVTTHDKGRGMAAQCDIPQSSLIHKEEPYALVILKSSRESHCHYCLGELPLDTVPCLSCSIPLYCSERCRAQAGGGSLVRHQEEQRDKSYGDSLEKHVMEVTSLHNSTTAVECFPEHKHECGGVHWPAVLPPDVVLAGRILAKHLSQTGILMNPETLITLGFSHNYSLIAQGTKLEVHIYASVLLCCLQHALGFELPVNAIYLSQTVILLSQIRVNAMAIIHMKSVDPRGPHAFTSTVEQVTVGQAIYKTGSMFNHSCQPNINAYFLSRTLFVRTTEVVQTGFPLELSYGPQVGQWDCCDRLQILEDKYSFRCRCSGCSELNIADLVLNAFHCANPDCIGVLLDTPVIKYETGKLTSSHKTSRLNGGSEVEKINVKSLVCLNLMSNNSSCHIKPASCLNCGHYCNLDAAREAVDNALSCMHSLEDAIASKEIPSMVLSDASRSLGLLRSVLHPYNKRIAEAEDKLAQGFCWTGDLRSSKGLCSSSIKILEVLYGNDHIVIGYELIKLATIQLSLDDPEVAKTITRLEKIFLRYFGAHANLVLPYLETLKKESLPLHRQFSSVEI
ncbi:unnamed protein product [Linum tenue]|uniref:SET domain-containing protein n=2 Tax=Linum tenue TaxID=586396 RepID=A0AAV0M2V6_9ROSI|nr:unnamed protein product [Linum tenue]